MNRPLLSQDEIYKRSSTLKQARKINDTNHIEYLETPIQTEIEEEESEFMTELASVAKESAKHRVWRTTSINDYTYNTTVQTGPLMTDNHRFIDTTVSSTAKSEVSINSVT